MVVKVLQNSGWSSSPAERLPRCCFLCIICLGIEVAGFCNLAVCSLKCSYGWDHLGVPPWAITARTPGAAQVEGASPSLHDLLLSATLELPRSWSWRLGSSWGLHPSQCHQGNSWCLHQQSPAPLGWCSPWEWPLNCSGSKDLPPWFRGCLQKGTRWVRLSWNSHKCHVQLPGWNRWIRKRDRSWCKGKKQLRKTEKQTTKTRNCTESKKEKTVKALSSVTLERGS